jgi:hypothetical protein
MGSLFFRSHPIQSPLATRKGMWRTYSNPGPHGANVRLDILFIPLLASLKLSIVKAFIYIYIYILYIYIHEMIMDF